MAIKIHGSKPATATKQAPASDTQTDLGTIGGTTTATPSETPQESTNATPSADTPPTTQSAPATNIEAPGTQTGAAFLMTGTQQRTQVDQVKAVQDLRSKLRGGAREFWLNPGEFAKLYFLDGKLLSDNVFDTPMISVHFLQIGGNWAKFVCNRHTEGNCVVCDSNADGTQPMTFQLFTVINAMPYTIQGGPNKGKVLPARLQLFPATLKVREKLMKRAQNHDNKLAGSFYQFSRESKQAARTGDDIEYMQDVPMQGVLNKYPMLGTQYSATKKAWEDAPTTVYDYAKVYPILTNAEIASLRPDIASMAGFTAYQPLDNNSTVSGFGNDPTKDMDSEIPF